MEAAGCPLDIIKMYYYLAYALFHYNILFEIVFHRKQIYLEKLYFHNLALRQSLMLFIQQYKTKIDGSKYKSRDGLASALKAH